ncbi:protein-L-isoaspartate(D-aspartate) O-methyltransferase [Oricola thermophila]|uniref:Protein-L-isoaspartate O-methyltransferase n=1 Tax=Oricola thermophila TaxID=2742145 RepID=A0A6N1VDS3_9HYPH|nr:protein-L-isoaspartate(D-aspartate) O-methyltransferase [Oricola thermophila]QKV17755.1 protein-L-isoaspartate(D-aspartate) O-methyltransferase [Oricola thermophila]
MKEGDRPELRAVHQGDREGFAAFLLRMRAIGLDDKALMSAFETVPRRDFIEAQYRHLVMGPRTVPIACGETLEGLDLQARILHALGIDDSHRVLEIGTGTGYTAAVMGKIAKRVYTVERFRTLHQEAVQRIRQLGISNVIANRADGSTGSEDGPFDRIVCWAAFDSIPRQFVDQLVSGGVMVCAIGGAEQPQALARLTKTGSRFEREDIGTVRFQPIASGLPEVL